MNLTITDRPACPLPFHGIGVETDCFAFDEANRECGVTDKDLEMIERRLRALQPALSRMFVCIDWFNPSLDGKTFDWALPYVGHLVRQLKILDSLETRVNLVLFSPHPPQAQRVEPLIDAMVALLARLRDVEKIRSISWTTLYNEPDSLYLHDSPLSRAVFGEERFAKGPRFAEYVQLNRLFLQRLKESGLSDIRLVVADTVWGHPMRVERMTLCREAFGDADVDYSYHNYNPEDPGFYTGNPNFAYPGMNEEAQLFRKILGPDKALFLWEFNAAAKGFGAFFPGIGPHGTDMLGSLDAGVAVADKVMAVIRHGVGGVCLWCLHDMLYLGGHKNGAMGFGLFRFKWQHWYPRPCYHYYALLTRAFRPGMKVLQCEGIEPGISSLAATGSGGTVVALLNTTASTQSVTIRGLQTPTCTQLRVFPEIIPDEGDLPVSQQQTVPVTAGTAQLSLAPQELTVLTTA